MKKQLLILLVLFSACVSTQQVSYITGISEATISLPEGAQNVSIVNRVRLAYPLNNSNILLLNANNTNLLNATYNSFRASILSQDYLTIFYESNEYKVNADGKYPEALSPADLKEIARGSDLVISLEKFDQRIEDSYTVEIRRQDLGNSTYREVDYFVGKRTIDVKLGWRLYHTKTGVVVDEWEEDDNYFYESESLTRARATQLLNNSYRLEMQNLGNTYGRRYASRISPTAYRQNVLLYRSGNESLTNGILQINDGLWTEAAITWQEGLDIELKRKQRAMLLHNLAINQERMGNNAEARRLAAEAAKEHPLGAKTQSIVGISKTN
jgi:hypothetical protein